MKSYVNQLRKSESEYTRQGINETKNNRVIALEDHRPKSIVQRQQKEVKNDKSNRYKTPNNNVVSLVDNRKKNTTKTEAPIQGVFIKGSKGKVMTSSEVQTYIASSGLTTAMRTEIARRESHSRHYVIDNTISGLLSGTITPAPPTSGSSSSWTRRTSAGYVNPSHSAVSVRPLFRDAAASPIPSSIADDSKEEWDHLSKPKRRFRTYSPTHTAPPVIVQGHENTVMGHGPVDAVDDWNSTGHTRARSSNKKKNKSASMYHGLEEKHASAKSGANTTSRYRPPSPSIKSHASHWDTTDPEYDERSAWHQRNLQRNQRNNVATAGNVTGGLGALGGMAAGAYLGSALGPAGTVLGGIAGGLMGWFGGKSGGKAAAKAYYNR